MPTPPRSSGRSAHRSSDSSLRRSSSLPRPAGRPGPGRRAKRPRWGMRLATTLSVLVLGAGGIGHAVMTSLNSGIGRVDAFKDMKNRPDEGHGLNFLLVGTDGRDKITEKERQKYRLGGAPCHCTDTIMLVHLSENGERASVVSVPRDSYAELPEHTDVTTGKHHKPHPVKINAAYAEGGPNLTVRTVEHLTGVKIGHYLEVDFTSFMKTVDALGGVEICTPRPLSDSYTGLDLTPGTHKLDGGQALQYVRSRHVDGTADLSRMERQQRFVAALISRATSSGVLLNPVKLRDIATTMLSSVRADSAFGTEEMLAVNEAMRGFSPSAAEFTSVPVIGNSVAVKGIGATVRWDPVKSKKLFQALREDKPLTPAETSRTPRPDETTETLANQASLRSPRTSLSPPISPSPPISQSPQISQSPRMSQSPQAAESRPGDVPGEPSPGPRGDVALVDVKPQRIRVQVINGTRTDGLGKQVDDALRATGFDTTRAPLTSDGRDARRTVVLYDPRWDRSAKSLAAALPGSELRAVRQQGPVLKVIAGSDYKAVRPVRVEEPPKGQFGTVTGDQVVCP